MGAEAFANYLESRKEINGIVKTGNNKTTILWRNLRINEWTFSLFLFVLSLGIVAGKLYINYGSGTRRSVTTDKNVNFTPSALRVWDVPDVENFQRTSSSLQETNSKSTGEKFFNASHGYGDATASAVVGITHKYAWFLRAASGGVAMMGFTWFIIYKDSSIPGVNPPSPFGPSKSRYAEKSRLQINYFVGVLNGLLIFIYMCL